MNVKLVALSVIGIASLYQVQAATNHPVREEMVEKIKQITDKWTPKEVHHNPLKDMERD